MKPQSLEFADHKPYSIGNDRRSCIGKNQDNSPFSGLNRLGEVVDNLKSVSTFVDILDDRALHQPDQIAYIFLLDGETESARLSYQQLEQRAKAIAAQLQLNLSQGERVLLLYPSGLEFITAFFGCLYAGVNPVPIYPPRRNQKLSRLQAITKNAQAKLALTTNSLLSSIEAKFSSSPELEKVPLLATDNISQEQGLNWYKPDLSKDDIAFLQYTSGSTGTPKGVMVTHENLLHNSRLIKMAFGHTTETIGVGWLPLFHDMGLIGNVLQPVYQGFPCVIMPPEAFIQKPIRLVASYFPLQSYHERRPNFAYELCVSKITPQERETLDISHWDVAFTGAEPVRALTLEKFATAFADCGFGAKAFYPCYGMAETTLFLSGGTKHQTPVIQGIDKNALLDNKVVAIDSQHPNAQLVVSCGWAWLDEKLVIVNPESLTECSQGQVGEIWVSSDSVAQGYWNRPKQTEQTFKAYYVAKNQQIGPFLRTGDLGFLLEGQLFVTGRLKDLIIIRGRNHQPQDIEFTVQQSNSALRKDYGAAFSIEIAGQEKLVVVQEVERRYLRKLNFQEVIQQIIYSVLQEHELDVYAVALLKTASIPKTSSGKIQRMACRAGFLGGNLDVIADWSKIPSQTKGFRELESDVDSLLEKIKTFSQPSETSGCNGNHSLSHTYEDIERWLIAKFAELNETACENIDIRENVGFDSLIAAELNHLFTTNWGVEIPMENFIEGVSVAGLTALLTEKISEIPSTSTEHIDQLTDEEVDALLSSILSK